MTKARQPSDDEAILLQALDALESIEGVGSVVQWEGQYEKVSGAIAAIRAALSKALGESQS